MGTYVRGVGGVIGSIEMKHILWKRLMYRGADKSLVLPTSRCILFDSENISFDASLVLYIYVGRTESHEQQFFVK